MPDCTAEQAAVTAAQTALTAAEAAAAISAQQAMDDATTVLSKEIDLFNANLALLACQQGGMESSSLPVDRTVLERACAAMRSLNGQLKAGL